MTADGRGDRRSSHDERRSDCLGRSLSTGAAPDLGPPHVMAGTLRCMALKKAVRKAAEDQIGLVTRLQLRQAGISKAAIDMMLRRGELVLAEEGVYRVEGAPVTDLQRYLAATMRAGGRITGEAACALHRIEGFTTEERPTVLIAKQRRCRGVEFACSTGTCSREPPLNWRGSPP